MKHKIEGKGREDSFWRYYRRPPTCRNVVCAAHICLA